MTLVSVLAFIPIFIAALTTAFLAVRAWQRRSMPAATHLVILMGCITWWLVSYGFETISQSEKAKLFWIYVEYLGLVLIPVAWLAFSLAYLGLGRWLSKRNLIFLLIVPVLTLLLVWTNPYHGWAWSNTYVDQSGPFPDIHVRFGPVLWISTAYSLSLIVIGVVLFIWSMLNRPLRRKQFLLYLSGAAIILATSVLDLTDRSPIAPWSLTPFAFAIVSILLILGMNRLRMLDIIPLAREVVIESMSDGVIILDPGNRIADLNLAARNIIGCTAQQALGQPVEKIWKGWPGEMTLPLGRVEIIKELLLNTPDGQRNYDLRISSLFDSEMRFAGRLVVLRDITRQKRAEDNLRRREEILEAIGFAAEQFLRRSGWEKIIQDVLGRLGEATGVSRVQVFENLEATEGKLLFSLRHEWAAWGIRPQISNPELQNLSLTEKGFYRWVEAMVRGQVIAGRVRTFPTSEQALLLSQGTQSVVVVPIFLGRTWWGYLLFDDCVNERDWTSIEIDALRAAANTIGAAIQRERGEAEVHHSAKVTSTLLSLTEMIGSTMDVPKVLEQVALAAHTLLPVDRVAVFLWDEEKNALVPARPLSGNQVHPSSKAETNNSPAQSVLGSADLPLIKTLEQNKQPIALSNVAASPLVPEAFSQKYNIRSLLIVPIVYQERLVGAVYADYTSKERVFTQQEIDLAMALARQSALAIERSRLYAQSREDAAELSALYRASTQLLNPRQDLKSLAQQITQTVVQDFSLAYCSILWLDQEKRQLVRLAQAGEVEFPEVYLPLDGPGITVYAANHKEIVYAPDVRTDPRYVQASSETRSEMALPLHAGGEVFGVLNLESPKPDAFDKRTRRILTAFSKDAALALQNTRLFIAAERNARQLGLLNEITRTALSISNFDEMLQALADKMIELIDSSQAFIALWDEERQCPIPAAASGVMREQYHNIKVEPGEATITATVLEAMRPIIVEDCFHSPYLSPRLAAMFSTVSILGLPLIADENKLGAILIGFDQPHDFTKDEIWLCEQAAGQVALAISRARSLKLARQRADEAETLRKAGAIVAQTLQEEEAIQLIMQQLEQVVHYDSASVQLLQDGSLKIVGAVGFPNPAKVLGMQFPIPGDNPNTLVIQNREPIILANAAEQYETFRNLPIPIRSWLGVPLIVRDRVIGMLAVDNQQFDYFSRDHARLVAAFADQVAIAIENARLYAAEQKRVQQLNALRATGTDISAILDLSELLQIILGRAVSLLEATGGELGLYRKAENELEIVASHNMGQDFSGTRIKMGEGAMGQVAESLEPLIVHRYKDWDGRSPQYAEGPWEAVIAAPLMIHGQLQGVIAVMYDDSQKRFSDLDLQLLTMFAQQSAIAVENARLYQEAQQSAERRAVLHRVSQEVVSASFEPEKIYEAIYRAAQQLMPTEAFAITLVDEVQRDIEAVYLIDKDGRAPSQRIPMHSGLSGRVIASGKPIHIADLEQESNFFGIHFGSPQHARSILAVPLRTGEKIIGMLSAQCYQPNAYTEEDQRLLEMLAANAAIAIENSRLLKEIQWLAITDPLTGLYNRRGLFDYGQREVERFRRFGRPFSAILIDIDLFKQINDTYGHAAGDQVLVALANGLGSQIREGIDIIGRYGGEEIVILLPETELRGGLQVAERLRQYVEANPIVTDRGTIPITISAGVAEFKETTPDLAMLIDHADSAMYTAKQSGRNRCKAYQEIPQSLSIPKATQSPD